MAENLDLKENLEEVDFGEDIQITSKNSNILTTIVPLNVRQKPDINGRIIRVLSEGAQVNVLEEIDDNWICIGDNEFVMKKFLI
jgi:hypothetical protein